MVTGNNKQQPDESFPPKPQTADEFRTRFEEFLSSDNFDIELEPGASERIWGNVMGEMAKLPELTPEEVEEQFRRFEEFQKSRTNKKPDPESLERIRKAVKERLAKLRKHQ